MNSEAVMVSLISAAGGVAVAWIANVTAKKVQHKKEQKGPADRFEQMFDGYDRLIRQKDAEDERKARLIQELQREIVLAKEMVNRLEEELLQSRRDIAMLKSELEEMRAEYELMKKSSMK